MRLFGSKIDPELVEAYRSAIPASVQVNIAHNGDTYLAKITGISEKPLPPEVFLITEATDSDKLTDMINDLIFTYKNIPVPYRPFYKQVLKPEGNIDTSEMVSLVKAA